ncbi:MAG: cation:proton antiporter [Victivallaceae bacterium]|nr:cation:proton antiporter [Victivallaceae bacterium]
MHEIALLALQLGVILFAARFCGNIVQKIGIPSVLGELIAGILIGPYFLVGVCRFSGWIFPLPAPEAAFPVSESLYAISTLGSVILLFMSGLETDLRMFFRYSVAGTLVGLGGVIFSFALGDLVGVWMLHVSVADPRSLFLGVLCTATSVGITARILSERKSIDSPEGTTILAAAVIDDVLGIVALAIVVGIVGAGAAGGCVNWSKIGAIAAKSFGIWLGATVIGLAVSYRFAKVLKFFGSAQVFSVLAFGTALILSGIFEECGLAMIIGAYVAGLSLSRTDIAFAIRHSLDGVYGFLVPVFFVVMGMLVDVRVLGDVTVLKFGFIYVGFAIAAKVIGCALPALFMNFNWIGGLRIGIGMIPRGEVALIIAGIGATTMMTVDGNSVPIIDARLFGVAIIMTLLTTLVAPPLLALVLSVHKKGVRKEKTTAALKHTRFPLPAEACRDFMLRAMIENFRKEGYRHSEIAGGYSIVHFRRERRTFMLSLGDGEMDFESSNDMVGLINTVVYETTIELHRALNALKEQVAPENFDRDLIAGAPDSHRNAAEIRVGKIIPTDCIVCDMQATDQESAIRELVDVLDRSGYLKDAELCLSDIFEREKLVSTCLGGGIALPHARTSGTKGLVAAVGISRAGCEGATPDKEKIHIFVLSVCPKELDGPYLQFVAHVAGVLGKPGNVDAILHAAPNEIRNYFLGRVSAKVSK